jgi:hypothetical protein
MRTYVLVACSAILLSVTARSDTIVLQDGEQLAGRIRAKDGRSLVFRSFSAGTVTVPWSRVESIITEGPVAVELTDGREYMGLVALTKDGAVGDGKKLPKHQLLKLSDVVALSTKHWRVRRGWDVAGEAHLSLKYDRGNGNRDEIDLDGRVVARDRKNRIDIRADLERDAVEDSLTKNSWLAELKYDRFLSRKVYAVACSIVEEDEYAELQLRSVGTVGLGWQIMEAEKGNVLAEALFGRIYENYLDASGQDYSSFGWRLEFDRRITVDGDTRVYFRHLGFWEVPEGDKVFTKTFAGIDTRVRDPVTIGVEVEHNYDRESPSSVNEEDWTYRVKVGVKWD